MCLLLFFLLYSLLIISIVLEYENNYSFHINEWLNFFREMSD